MRNTFKNFIYTGHIYLLPVYFTTYELLKTYRVKSELPLGNTILNLIAALGFTLIIRFIISLSNKSSYKASVYASLLFCILFFFPTWIEICLNNSLISKFISIINIHKKITIFILLITCYLILLVLTWKQKIEFKTISLYLTLLIISFTILGIVNISLFKPNDIKLKDSFNTIHNQDIEKPDIYYIILDSYSSNKNLEKYSHDNKYFTDFLDSHGFYVAHQSNSNYNYTSSSLSSSLNSSYLNIRNRGRYSMSDLRKLSKFINKNRIANYLESQGYEQNNYSLYGIGTHSSQLINLPTDKAGGSKSFLASLLRSFYQTFDQNDQQRLNKAYFNYNINSFSYLDSLSKLSDSDLPKFNYIHILATHPPFVIDAKGRFENNLKLTHNKDSYIREIKYTNSRIMTFINTLLSQSGKKPVIIIQSDHGAHLNDLKETTTILNAYYFPDKDYKTLYQTISPVNSFRVILNKYFHSNIKLLPDSSFYVNYP